MRERNPSQEQPARQWALLQSESSCIKINRDSPQGGIMRSMQVADSSPEWLIAALSAPLRDLVGVRLPPFCGEWSRQGAEEA